MNEQQTKTGSHPHKHPEKLRTKTAHLIRKKQFQYNQNVCELKILDSRKFTWEVLQYHLDCCETEYHGYSFHVNEHICDIGHNTQCNYHILPEFSMQTLVISWFHEILIFITKRRNAS